jgi:hypothetical protein
MQRQRRQPLSCTPAQGLRKWLVKNDLRTYTPTAPLFLCGGDADPLVPYANTTYTAAYFRAQGSAGLQLTVLDVDDNAHRPIPHHAEFAAAKRCCARGAGQRRQRRRRPGGKDAYHAGLVAPFCLREARLPRFCTITVSKDLTWINKRRASVLFAHKPVFSGALYTSVQDWHISWVANSTAVRITDKKYS